jgi:hypothetical protein
MGSPPAWPSFSTRPQPSDPSRPRLLTPVPRGLASLGARGPPRLRAAAGTARPPGLRAAARALCRFPAGNASDVDGHHWAVRGLLLVLWVFVREELERLAPLLIVL